MRKLGLVLSLTAMLGLASWATAATSRPTPLSALAGYVINLPAVSTPEVRASPALTDTWQILLPYASRNYLSDGTSTWLGQILDQWSNCGLTRVFGHTLDQNGDLIGDIWVHYWGEGWEGDWARSLWFDFGQGTPWPGDDGNWDGTIDTRPRDGVWHVCVAEGDESWTCISNIVDAVTSSDCISGVQVVRVTFRRQD